MPKTKTTALKPATITRLQGKSSFRIGPPPEPGKAVTTGRGVCFGDFFVDVGPGAVAVAVVPGRVAVAVAPDSVAVAVGRVGVAVGAGGARQVEPVMVLASNVTAPVCARARPFKLAPVCRLMDVRASIFPMNVVPVPRVPDETSLHHTLHGSPPVTDELADVVSVAADLKIQTPDPLSVRFPVSMKASAQ
jgi:hypothetical protein